MRLIYRIKLFLYNLFHKKSLFNVKNIVCFVCGNEELPQPLELEEEESLLLAKERGDELASARLIEHNLRLVVYIAKKFDKTGIEFEDLISIGSVGLIKAIKTFKLDKNIRLATYASRCIENEILMQIRKISKLKQDVSLDAPIFSDGEGNELILSEIMPNEEDEVGSAMELSADKKVVSDLISTLNVREQEIMILRYGLEGQDELTQREVAEKLGISQSYISRIEKKILGDMKVKLEELRYY
ncbi:MAG: RNA polymerase sporulation sigma factor SigK [Acetobacter sp.]|nr:RNA polymerase sporulation sigma factor SigK [Acetobacter sp.]